MQGGKPDALHHKFLQKHHLCRQASGRPMAGNISLENPLSIKYLLGILKFFRTVFLLIMGCVVVLELTNIFVLLIKELLSLAAFDTFISFRERFKKLVAKSRAS